MADVRLNVILDAIVTRMAAITVGGGYRSEVLFTSREQRLAGEHVGYPAIDVWAAGGPRAPGTFGDGPSSRRMELTVMVSGFVRGPNSSSAIVDLLDDMTKALQADPGFLGLAYITKLEVTDFGLGAQALKGQLYGELEATALVQYRMSRTTL